MVQCSKCQKPFARVSTLKRHLETKHSDVVTKLRCPGCDKSFVRADHWRRHYEDLHGDGRKACSNCLREFRSDYLKQHQSTCRRKPRLPGQIVVLNSGSSRSTTAPRVSDSAVLQQCLQASLTPIHVLRMSDEDAESRNSPAASDTLLIASQQDDIDISIVDEPTIQDYAKIIEDLQYQAPDSSPAHQNAINERLETANLARTGSAMSAFFQTTERSPFKDGSPIAPPKRNPARTAAHTGQQQNENAKQVERVQHQSALRREPTKTIPSQHAVLDCTETDQQPLFQRMIPQGYRYDKNGRVTFDEWPFRPQDYPDPHPSLIAGIEVLQQYSPDVDVVATMKPCLVNVESGKIHRYDDLDGQLPVNKVRQMVPCILCKDCGWEHIVSDLQTLIGDFNFDHGRAPSHRRRLRERLIPRSKTVKYAISGITNHDFESLQTYISQLVDGKMLTTELVDNHYHQHNECILALAVENDEKDVFACLLEEYHDETSDWSFARRLVNSSDDLDIAKVIVHKTFGAVLYWRDDDGLPMLDRWIKGGRVSAAVELLEFDSHQNQSLNTPLEAACLWGQTELIAAMLERSKNTISRGHDRGKALALSIALHRARVEGVRMLLEAGAEVNSLSKYSLAALQNTANGPDAKHPRGDYQDAVAKLALLDEYRLFGPPSPTVQYVNGL